MFRTRPLASVAAARCSSLSVPHPAETSVQTTTAITSTRCKRRRPLLHNSQHQQHRTLVTHLSPTVSLLRADDHDNEVYLVGTAHVSEASAREVSELIETHVKPQTVFIELDPARAARLRRDRMDDDNLEDELVKQASQKLRSLNFPPQLLKSTFNFRAEMLESYFKRFYRMLKGYGLVPGIDMWTAMQAGEKVGATIYYGDRGAQETMRDLAASVHLSQLLKAATVPVPDEMRRVLMEQQEASHNNHQDSMAHKVEALKTREYAQQMLAWMDEALPQTADVLVHQRDAIMARNLRQHCAHGKVVAVVGMAHLEGIEREWSNWKK